MTPDRPDGAPSAPAPVSTPSGAELVAITRIEGWVKVAKYALVGLGIFGAGWLLRAPLIAMAGKKTNVALTANADFGVDATAEVN
jgi:hypothetical protein